MNYNPPLAYSGARLPLPTQTGFYADIADTFDKADNGHGGVSCKEENTRRSSNSEAVALANQPGVTKAQIGRELDINPNMITRWQREMAANGSKAFLGQGVARDEEMTSYTTCTGKPGGHWWRIPGMDDSLPQIIQLRHSWPRLRARYSP